MKFPENEKILIRQLGNYIVKKQMESGKIVYDQNNEGIGDHRLDAFVLALGGLALEESVYSTNYGMPPDTYHVSDNRDSSNAEFTSSMQDALGILKVLKKQKSGVQLDVLAIRRGNGSVEQERNIFNNEKWNENDPDKYKREKARSDLSGSVVGESKGYFSSKGLAKFSETGKGEDTDATTTSMSTPIRIDHTRSRDTIRTGLKHRPSRNYGR